MFLKFTKLFIYPCIFLNAVQSRGIYLMRFTKSQIYASYRASNLVLWWISEKWRHQLPQIKCCFSGGGSCLLLFVFFFFSFLFLGEVFFFSFYPFIYSFLHFLLGGLRAAVRKILETLVSLYYNTLTGKTFVNKVINAKFSWTFFVIFGSNLFTQNCQGNN